VYNHEPTNTTKRDKKNAFGLKWSAEFSRPERGTSPARSRWLAATRQDKSIPLLASWLLRGGDVPRSRAPLLYKTASPTKISQPMKPALWLSVEALLLPSLLVSCSTSNEKPASGRAEGPGGASAMTQTTAWSPQDLEFFLHG